MFPEPLRDVDLGGLQLEHSFQLCSTIRDDYRTFFTKCGELGSDDLLKSGLRELLQCDKVYRFAMDFVAKVIYERTQRHPSDLYKFCSKHEVGHVPVRLTAISDMDSSLIVLTPGGKGQRQAHKRKDGGARKGFSKNRKSHPPAEPPHYSRSSPIYAIGAAPY